MFESTWLWFDQKENLSDLMRSIFESIQSGAEISSYVKVYNEVWSACVCSSVDCDSFVLYNILCHSWQAGTKMSFYI